MKTNLTGFCVIAALLSLLFGCDTDEKRSETKQDTKITRIGTSDDSEKPKSESGEKKTEQAVSKTEASTTTANPETSVSESKSGEPTIYLSGRVTSTDGSPVGDALVQLSGPGMMYGMLQNQEESNLEVKTRTDGNYEISTTDTGYLLARFSKEGMAKVMMSIYDDKVQFVQDRKTDLRVTKNVILAPGTEISGKVVDDAGAPVTSATITAVPDIYSRPQGIDQKKPIPDTVITTSSADGTFKLTQLMDQDYILTADNPDYVGASQNAKAPAENITITMAREGGKIDGMVVLLSNNEAVNSATVNLMMMPEMRGAQRLRGMGFKPKKTVTAPDGSFNFDKLPAGKFMLSASKDQLQPLNRNNNNPGFSLAAKETTSGVVLALYPGHTVTGVITNFETKEPIEGVTVRNQNFYWGPTRHGVNADAKKLNETQTDSHGRYTLGSQFGPQVSLSLEKKGYKLYTPDRNNWSTPQVMLTPDVFEVEKNMEMAATISIFGAVKLENGRNAVGAKITPFVRNDHGQKPEILTDKNGAYEVEVSPFTQVRIKAALSQFPAAFSELVEVDDKSVTASDIIVKAGGTIAGTVVGPDDQPMPEAKVNSYISIPLGGGYSNSDSIGDVTTDAAGNFLITNVPEGQLYVGASKKGFARSKNDQIAMASQEAKTGVRLKLGKGFSISGRVVDEKKEPISGANLNAWMRNGGGGSGHATTDEKGIFKMEDLSEGAYEVSAYASNYNQVSKPGVKTGTEDLEIVMKPQGSKPDEKEPQGSGVFIGKVTDWKTKQPVTDFKVEIRDYSSGHKLEMDQPNGRFTINGLRIRYGFSLTITSPGYMPVRTSTLSVQSLTKPTEQEFVMGPGGTLSGRVVAKDDKRPLENVRVLLLGVGEEYNLRDKQPEKVTQTAADGTFSFEQVAAGKNWVQLRPTAPIVAQRRSLDVQQGTAADFGDIELGTGGVIAGKIIRVPGDAPVAEANIEANYYEGGVTKSTKSDAKGEFRIEGLTPGGYSINASQHKLNSYQQVKDGETANVTLKVGSGVLNGVVLKRGTPLTDTQVSMNMDGQSASKSAQTDIEGKFKIDGLAPGKWKIQIMPRYSTDDGSTYYGGYRQPENIDIPEGELTKTFEIPSGRILGSVVDAAGQPVPKVRLTLKPPAGMNIPSYGERLTKDDGTFMVDDLDAGEYQVSARHNTIGYGAAKANVPANGDVENVVLKLEKGNGGTLVSVVLNLEGQPVQAAWCNLTGPGGSFVHDAQRDASGMMTITDIPPGKYKVEVSYWSHSDSTREVEIKSGETVRIDDVLYAAGALRWTLQDKDGGPVRNANCTLTPTDPNSIEKVRTGTTDYNGLWVVRGMGAGEYTATATLPDSKTISEKVNIAAGQPTAVTTKAP